MKLDHAVSQLTEIHSCMTRAAYYRGYRSLPVAVSGVLGLFAAFSQPYFIEREDPRAFVFYWVAVACIAVVIGGGSILVRYFTYSDRTEKRRTETVIGQALPCLVAGLLLTVGIVASKSANAMTFLPAIWAFVYGMVVVASRPFLPRMVGWVVVFYFLAGSAMLIFCAPNMPGALSGWAMGLTFGIGQLLAAFVLYWNLERKTKE